jgi:hypothetical protein
MEPDGLPSDTYVSLEKSLACPSSIACILV